MGVTFGLDTMSSMFSAVSNDIEGERVVRRAVTWQPGRQLVSDEGQKRTMTLNGAALNAV
jgi:hypothetical protein